MSNKQNDIFFESKKEAEDEREGKTLYCPTCKEYPNKIIERYLEPIEETREWDKFDDYGLIYSNFEDVEYEQLCRKCRTKLEFKPQIKKE